MGVRWEKEKNPSREVGTVVRESVGHEEARKFSLTSCTCIHPAQQIPLTSADT